MADVNRTIHVKVLTFDPAQDTNVPVPDARLLVEDDGWLWDPDLSDGSHTTNATGEAQVEITFDETKENNLNPFFTITLAAGQRTLPAGSPAAKQFEAPEKWVTRHYKNRRIPQITTHTNPNTPLEIYLGLKARLRVSYTDFDRSGTRNPMALPEKTARIYLADHDYFLFDWAIFDWLNPDDTLKGVGFDPVQDTIVQVGQQDQYPYFDVWPTAPKAIEGLPAQPRAWLDLPGAPVGRLGGSSFRQVGPMAVSPDGFVFMVDDKKVLRFYPDGTLAETIEAPTPGFSAPGGLAVDQYGNLFVADTGRDQIVIFRPAWWDAGGNTYVHERTVGLLSAAIPPLSPFTFDDPRGLAVVPNRVVEGEEMLALANTGSSEVALFRIRVGGTANLSIRHSQTLSVDLLLETTFGSAGNNANQFQQPVGVAADREGRLFVCDKQLHRVSRWQLNAARTSAAHQVTWQKSGGGNGAGNGEFDTPEAIAVDANKKYVYVAESGNQRIQRLDADSGSTHTQWQPAVSATTATPQSVAVDARGDVFVADGTNTRVHRGSVFNSDGANRADADDPRAVGDPWTPVTDAAHMKGPSYVYFDGQGRLWVSDAGNNRVLVFERNASNELEANTTLGAPDTALLDPVGLAMDPDDDLFVVDSGHHLIRHYSGSPLTRQGDIGTGTAGNANTEFDHPRGLVIVQRTEPLLYVADRDNDRVQVLQRDGTFVTSLAPPSGGSFDKPEDVAADTLGNVYVVDTGNRRIVQYDAEDNFVREFTVPTPNLPTGVTAAPCGVSVDDENKLIVTDRTQNKVLRLEANGTLLAFWDLKNLLRQSVANDFLYYPELARQVVFDSPARAVVDAKGLLAVADTGLDRLRFIRIHTAIKLNLFDLGEDTPDIIFHAKTKADRKDELGLKLNVGDVSIFDDSHDFETSPLDDFARDVYEHTQTLGSGRSTNAAINAMKIVWQVQHWYQQHTRMDEADHRWGKPGTSRTLNFDLLSGDASFQILDVYLGMGATDGRGGDAWDDGVVAHEMTHWVFYKALKPHLPFTSVGERQLNNPHSKSQLTTENQALSEGWANYIQLFWGYEFGRNDRVRGYAITRDAGTSLTRLTGISNNGNAPYVHLFGGLTSAGAPSFDQPEQGLRSEGYIANALHQIHCALTCPDVAFADAPSYWHFFNVNPSDTQSQRYADTIWRALRLFPADPPTNELDRFSMIYLRSVLASTRARQADFAQMVQSLFELNNLLMPRITITDGGAAVGDSVAVQVGVAKVLTIKVNDATGTALRGYNLHIEIVTGAAGHYSVPGGSGPTIRHGVHAPAAPVAGHLHRATKVNGQVVLTVTAGPGTSGNTETVRVTYQPDFDTDDTFVPPAKADDRETTLRQNYLYALCTAAKTWSGTGDNFGAIVVKTVTINIQ